MQNLGLVQAIIESQTAPGNTKVIWRKVDGSNNLIDFYQYVSGSWKSFSEMYSERFIGDSAPSDTNKVWFKTSSDSVVDIQYYINGNWESIDTLFNSRFTGDSAPSDTKKIWFKTSGSSLVVDILYYIKTGWTSIFTLFQAVYDGVESPEETWKLWLDTTSHPNIFKYFNTSSDRWDPLFYVSAITHLGGDLNIITNHNQQIISCENPSTIYLGDEADVGTIVVIEKVFQGDQVIIIAIDDNKINGNNGDSYSLGSDFGSVYIRKYSDSRWILIGNLE